MLKGYRTYIAAVGILVAALLKFVDAGGDFHALFSPEVLAMIGAAGAAIFGRAALAGVIEKTDKTQDIVRGYLNNASDLLDAVDQAVVDLRKGQSGS